MGARSMDRQKCVECPFRNGDFYDEGWIRMLDKEAEKPVGCHMIMGGDNLLPAKGQECVGHLKYLDSKEVACIGSTTTERYDN
jgi:hypothetical protein